MTDQSVDNNIHKLKMYSKFETQIYEDTEVYSCDKFITLLHLNLLTNTTLTLKIKLIKTS